MYTRQPKGGHPKFLGKDDMLIFSAFVASVAFLILSFSQRLPFVLRIVALLAGIAVICITVFFLLAGPPVVRGPEEIWLERTPWKELILFNAMIIGMASKYLWDLIELRRAKNEKLSQGQPKVPLEFDIWDFLQPLLVAGIVFSGVLVAQKQINPSSILFSFQNGFFWQTVLKHKLAEPAR